MFKKVPPTTPVPRIARELVKLLGGLGLLIALAYFVRNGGHLNQHRPESIELVDVHKNSIANQDLCGPPVKDGRAVVLDMVYSDDMREWIEAAANSFSRRCPNIQVKLTAVPDIAAADSIIAGQLQPVMWVPTDDLALRYLDNGWKQRGRARLFNLVESISVVESPLVILIWQDRLRLLSSILREEPSDQGQWARSLCALVPQEPDLQGVPIEAMVPGTWAQWYAPLIAPPPASPRNSNRDVLPAVRPIGDEPLPTLDEVKKWGTVKIAHARPTHDSAGLAALYLMSYDYARPAAERSGIAKDDSGEGLPSPEEAAAAKAKLRSWLRRCEAGLGAPQPTASALTAAIFNDGPMAYDGVVTYEHLALPYLVRVDSHADALRKLVVIYPKPLLLARHPAVLFDASPEKQEAAQRWRRFLLSKEMQERAVDAGFRPVNPQVTVGGYHSEQNQFPRLRRYGVLLQPQWTEAPRPDGQKLQELIGLWGEVTGRN